MVRLAIFLLLLPAFQPLTAGTARGKYCPIALTLPQAALAKLEGFRDSLRSDAAAKAIERLKAWKAQRVESDDYSRWYRKEKHKLARWFSIVANRGNFRHLPALIELIYQDYSFHAPPEKPLTASFSSWADGLGAHFDDLAISTFGQMTDAFMFSYEFLEFLQATESVRHYYREHWPAYYDLLRTISSNNYLNLEYFDSPPLESKLVE